MTPCCPVMRQQAARANGALQDAMGIVCAITALPHCTGQVVNCMPGCTERDFCKIYFRQPNAKH